MSAIGRPPVTSMIAESATKAMKLCRPIPSGPRKRAAATEMIRTYSCGKTRATRFQTPPRTTLAPVVRSAARPGGSGPAAVEVMRDTLDMGSARAAVICPVLPYPPVGGGHKRTLRLLEAMERAHVTPQIVTTDGSRPDGVAELRGRGWSV